MFNNVRRKIPQLTVATLFAFTSAYGLANEPTEASKAPQTKQDIRLIQIFEEYHEEKLIDWDALADGASRRTRIEVLEDLHSRLVAPQES